MILSSVRKVGDAIDITIKKNVKGARTPCVAVFGNVNLGMLDTFESAYVVREANQDHYRRVTVPL
ncbi:hypothetical protein MPLSOD_150087 [Mesorhizobium sp. SOD10]|nr:hypothetical protein MPLSOD_150087 [Mesorhizobium sp. SOD10]